MMQRKEKMEYRKWVKEKNRRKDGKDSEVYLVTSSLSLSLSLSLSCCIE